VDPCGVFFSKVDFFFSQTKKTQQMNALDTIRAFITDNLFMGDDFLVVRAQDQTGDFFCVKISPITQRKERGLLFEKYTCEDIRTLNDFMEKSEEFNADLDFLKSLNIIVVQFQRDGLRPVVIFGEWENPQDEDQSDFDENDNFENLEPNAEREEDFEENEKDTNE
jgi:hypothetical protein